MGNNNVNLNTQKWQTMKPSLFATQPDDDKKKICSLITRNTLINAVKDKLSGKDLDSLSDAFDTADTQDLYGNEEIDFILNEKEQQDFLKNLQQEHPKIFNVVNEFIDKLNSKSDKEKIFDNFSLKVRDYDELAMNEQLFSYSMEFLDNENLLELIKDSIATIPLYDTFEEATQLATSTIYFSREQFDDSYYDSKIAEKNEMGYENLIKIEKKCESFSKYLLQIAKENNIYTQDYEKDLAEAIELNDRKKLVITTQRLAERVIISTDKDKTINASKRAIPAQEPNGKIDEQFVQGYTGDCWFLAALKSLCANKNLIEKINNKITINKKDNTVTDVTVKIKGKNYTIDYENLKNANEYATGDMDVRALEIAVNQYIHENNTTEEDISFGGIIKDAYIYLFKEKDIKVKEFGIEEEFDAEEYLNEMETSNNNKVSVLGTYGVDGEMDVFAEDTEGNPVKVHLGHAFTFSKTDENYLYFIDPQEPGNEYRITKDRVGEVFGEATVVKFRNK